MVSEGRSFVDFWGKPSATELLRELVLVMEVRRELVLLAADAIISLRSSVMSSVACDRRSQWDPSDVLKMLHFGPAEGLRELVLDAEGLRELVLAAEGLRESVLAAEDLREPVLAAEDLRESVLA